MRDFLSDAFLIHKQATLDKHFFPELNVLAKSQYLNLPAIVCSFDATVCIDFISVSTLASLSIMCRSLFWSLGTFGAIG